MQNQPTYTTREALNLLVSLDIDGVLMLGELLTEEKKRYSLVDLRTMLFIYEMRLSIAETLDGILTTYKNKP